MSDKQIVALGLLTHDVLPTLGACFTRAYPIDDVPCFEALLSAIDDADRQLWRKRDEAADQP